MNILTILITCISIQIINTTIIGVDLGTEFIKIAMHKPNGSILMVENLQSKTKTPFAISFKGDEREFGSDALVKKSKLPEQVFVKMHEFLGRSYQDEEVHKFLNEFFNSYSTEEDENRKTFIFGINYGLDKTKYKLSTEEIFAMMFRYIKFISDKYSQSEIKECVITYPNFFGYKERLSIAQAVEISGLKLRLLVTENTCAAVNYAMNTKFTKENKYVVFYNIGASYTQATLASFRSRYEFHPKDKNKTIEHQYIKIIDETWDSNLGGRNFDFNIVRHLLKMFYEKNGKIEELNYLKNNENKLRYLENNHDDELNLKNKITRTAEKILPSAIKYKEILSANKEANIHILGVEDGINLNGILTRKEFEDFSYKDFEKVYKPIQDIIDRNSNKVSINDIAAIEFIGGGGRIPLIKEIPAIKSKIGNHMNGDDAVAMGAAFIASNFTLSTGLIYNNKKTDLLEYGNNYQLKIKLSNPVDSNICSNEVKEITRDCSRKLNKDAVIFKSRGGVDLIKFVNFRHDSDFDVNVYEHFNYTNKQNHLMTFHVKVDDKVNKIINEKGFTGSIPKINFKFSLDSLGLLTLKAELHYDILYYLAMAKDNKGKHTFKYTTEEQKPISANELIEEIDKVNANKEYTKSEKERIIKKLKNEIGTNKTETKKFELEIITEFSPPLPMTKTQLIKSRVQLNNFDSIDETRALNAEKRNLLETSIYSKREWIDSENAFIYGKQDELEEFRNLINESAAWYDKEGYKENAQSISDKLNKINSAYKIFEDRLEVSEKRKVAIEYFHSEIDSAQRVAQNLSETKNWLEDYINGDFAQKLKELNDWLDKRINEQQKIYIYQKPYLTAEDIYKKLDELKVELNKLRKMPKPIEDF